MEIDPSGYRTDLGILKERDKSNSVAWWFVLPAAAVVTTDVWFTENETFQLIMLNITGAMMEGFFATWESGNIAAHSVSTAVIENLADNFRAFFLSTYTSWAGMIGFAATIANTKGSIAWGLLYMIASIILGFLAHGIGGSIAKVMSKNYSSKGSKPHLQSRARVFTKAVLFVLTFYIFVSYALVLAHVRDFTDAFASARYFISTGIDDQRLLVAVACSIAGAYTGNLVGNMVDNLFHKRRIIAGTLFCNTFFAALSLVLPALTLRQPEIWKNSLWLAQFSTSFCGAASAFAGHISDLRGLWKQGNIQHVIQNAVANIIASSVVLLIGIELERLILEEAPNEDNEL